MTQPQKQGAIIDRMFELREEKNELNAKIKDIDAEFDKLQTSLMAKLDEEEATMSRGKRASAVITETDVAQITDRQAFMDYMRENDAIYLLQMRVSNPAWRELLKAEGEIPGTEPFTKRSISLRKVN